MTYTHIKNAAKKTEQISFNDLVSKRFRHISKGWSTLKVFDYDINSLVNCIGGSSKINYHRLIMDYKNHGSTYGILSRLIYTGKEWQYIAGQDHVVELNTIRKIFRDGR